MLKGFKDFIMRGNLIELAVAFVIGAAFATVVKSFTDMLMSFIGEDRRLSRTSRVSRSPDVNVGIFINSVISFLIVAAVIYFFVVTPYNRLQERMAKGDEASPRVPGDRPAERDPRPARGPSGHPERRDERGRPQLTTGDAGSGAAIPGPDRGVLAGAWLVLCGCRRRPRPAAHRPLARSVGARSTTTWPAGSPSAALPRSTRWPRSAPSSATPSRASSSCCCSASGSPCWRRTWLPLAFVTVGYVGLLGVYLVATQLAPRDRPPVEILDKGLVPDHSFPSGHTMTSTAVVWTLLLLLLDVHQRVSRGDPRGWWRSRYSRCSRGCTRERTT